MTFEIWECLTSINQPTYSISTFGRERNKHSKILSSSNGCVNINYKKYYNHRLSCITIFTKPR
uniref:Uncharacterized protein n=1 Tax=viral metagenome TaxID=1070528 RepID=A0A6C0JDS3_9ZZZZ